MNHGYTDVIISWCNMIDFRMADIAGKIRTVSLLLSRILDEEGLTERTVKKIQHTGLKREKIKTIMHRLGNNNITVYIFGSSIEGTSTRYLKPDHDEIWCFDDYSVHVEPENDVCLSDGKANLMVLEGSDTPAGHCRLKVLSYYWQDAHFFQWQDAHFFQFQNGLCYKGDSLYVKNNVFNRHIDEPGCVAHGPAVTINAGDKYATTDSVYAFKCYSVSKQMTVFIEGIRQNALTTRGVLDTAEKSGFLLVPVGHRLSKDEDRELEWRISPSLTERRLMFGMNIIQIKCYVILKMLKKDLIAPQLGDCISSFHLKTILLYCVENTPKDLWQEDHLLLCINLFIYLLLIFVDNKCCANYLIPDENLFLGKIRNEQYIRLDSIRRTLMNSNGQYLFAIRCNNLGQKVRERLDLYGRPTVLVSPTLTLEGVMEEIMRMGLCEHKVIKSICSGTFDLLHVKPHGDLGMSSYVKWVQYLIDKLHVLLNAGDVDTSSAAASYLKFMNSTYGSLLGCLCIRDGKHVSSDAICFLELGHGSDLASGRLKHASVLFCSKRYDEAARVLEGLEQRWSESKVANVCTCLTSTDEGRTLTSRIALTLHYQCISECKTESEILKLMACDVMFTIHEVFCCPQALIFELFRDVGDDRKRRHSIFDKWMDFAVADSNIILYFLMYTVYGKLGDRDLQIYALKKFEGIVIHRSEYTNHTETAYNLLGQCYEMEQMFDDALSCYRQSLKIRRRNNAAMWIMTLLIYKLYCRPM